jgi:hypothetical protein
MLDALARYSWNSHLGASLYPTLLHLEVAFRNRLHDAIASRYPIGPWRDTDCWLGRVPSVLAPSEVAQVQVATDRLRRSGKTIAPRARGRRADIRVLDQSLGCAVRATPGLLATVARRGISAPPGHPSNSSRRRQEIQHAAPSSQSRLPLRADMALARLAPTARAAVRGNRLAEPRVTAPGERDRSFPSHVRERVACVSCDGVENRVDCALAVG